MCLCNEYANWVNIFKSKLQQNKRKTKTWFGRAKQSIKRKKQNTQETIDNESAKG